MLNYEEFWDKLKYAYPVSNGEIRIPINSKLEELNIDMSHIMNELHSITNELLSLKDDIEKFIENNGENYILNLLEGKLNGIIRFDGVIDKNNNFKIVEVNCDYPDGLLLHDYTFSILSDSNVRKHLNNFIELFDKDENIYIIYPEDEKFLDGYYQEYYSLKEKGFNVFIGTQSGLTVENNNVFFYGEKIDVIRRDMEVYKFSNNFLKSISNTNVRFVNSFDLRALGYKSILNKINSDYIPKSFIVNENNKSYLLNHKDKYVVKPSNLSEGGDVYIGKNYNLNEWENIVKSANLNNFIAQEFIDMKKINVNLYENGGIIEKNLYFDICPHFFIKNGKIYGEGLILMRFSENNILNVFQGGGIGYYNYL